MQKFVLLIASLYGFSSVILGAFGAHALKKMVTPTLLDSFETGVKYQMYHAIVLLIIGFYFSFSTKAEIAMGWMFIIGTFLFSVSIFFLVFSNIWEINLKFLGSVTPLGGLLLIVGWGMLFYNVLIRF